MEDPVLVEAQGAVRTVTLNRPDKRNALNGAMLEHLTELFREEPDPAQRVTRLERRLADFAGR